MVGAPWHPRCMAVTVALDPRMPAGPAFTLVLEALAHDIEREWERATDDADAEGLHDLRVALRRSRAVLGAGRRVLPAALVAEAVPRLRELTDITGPARDLDVLVAGWEAEVAAAGAAAEPALDLLRGQVGARRDEERARLSAHLLGDDARSWRRRWPELLVESGSPDRPGDHADRPVRRVAGDRLAALHRRLLRRGRAVGSTSTDPDLHDVRKAARRLRHLLEAFATLLPADAHREAVGELKALQDVLGRHQDLAVHLELVERAVHDLAGAGTPLAPAGVERLTTFLAAARDSARAEFSTAFAAYDRRRSRRAFRHLVADAG